MPAIEPEPDEPYCGNCGYRLGGLVDSSKCPECGKPLVEVLRRGAKWRNSGKRYTSAATVFGKPFIHIALGPKDNELKGKARGFIAIGDDARGFIAIGGMARGFVAIGGLAIGGFTMGGLSLGVFSGMGGLVTGLIAAGGLAIGGLTNGGMAIGYVAQGGGAVGVYARGGGAFGAHTISPQPGASSAEATAMFDRLSWFFGTWPPTPMGTWLGLGWPIMLMIVAGTLAMLVGLALRSKPNEWEQQRDGNQ